MESLPHVVNCAIEAIGSQFLPKNKLSPTGHILGPNSRKLNRELDTIIREYGTSRHTISTCLENYSRESHTQANENDEDVWHYFPVNLPASVKRFMIKHGLEMSDVTKMPDKYTPFDPRDCSFRVCKCDGLMSFWCWQCESVNVWCSKCHVLYGGLCAQGSVCKMRNMCTISHECIQKGIKTGTFVPQLQETDFPPLGSDDTTPKTMPLETEHDYWRKKLANHTDCSPLVKEILRCSIRHRSPKFTTIMELSKYLFRGAKNMDRMSEAIPIGVERTAECFKCGDVTDSEGDVAKCPVCLHYVFECVSCGLAVSAGADLGTRQPLWGLWGLARETIEAQEKKWHAKTLTRDSLECCSTIPLFKIPYIRTLMEDVARKQLKLNK